jgi:hypothetical protein
MKRRGERIGGGEETDRDTHTHFLTAATPPRHAHEDGLADDHGVDEGRVELLAALLEPRRVGPVDDVDDAVHVRKVLRPHAADAAAAAEVV